MTEDEKRAGARLLRIFLDANILFSAAKSAGTVRLLVNDLLAGSHTLVVDSFVVTEARRNLSAKADPIAVALLQQLLERMEHSAVQFSLPTRPALEWLPEKDRPVLAAAMALQCDVLVTGDRTHFGSEYGRVFDGVMVCSPVQLARMAWPSAASD